MGRDERLAPVLVLHLGALLGEPVTENRTRPVRESDETLALSVVLQRRPRLRAVCNLQVPVLPVLVMLDGGVEVLAVVRQHLLGGVSITAGTL